MFCLFLSQPSQIKKHKKLNIFFVLMEKTWSSDIRVSPRSDQRGLLLGKHEPSLKKIWVIIDDRHCTQLYSCRMEIIFIKLNQDTRYWETHWYLTVHSDADKNDESKVIFYLMTFTDIICSCLQRLPKISLVKKCICL